MLVDSVDSFEPGPGEAIIEPGTSNAEVFTYNGIAFNPSRLFGVDRPTRLDHPLGSVVQPSVTTGSPSPKADRPSSSVTQSEESQSKDRSEADPVASGSTQDSQIDSHEGSLFLTETSQIPDACSTVEEQPIQDACDAIDLVPIPESCENLYIDHLGGSLVACANELTAGRLPGLL